MNKLTPEQQKRRKHLLAAHYGEQDTHDYRSPKEWQRQIFWLEVKKTLFHLTLTLAIGAVIVVGLLKLAGKL